MSDPFDRERGHYGDLYNQGLMNDEEYRNAMLQVDRDERDSLLEEAERAADQAYRDVLGY